MRAHQLRPVAFCVTWMLGAAGKPAGLPLEAERAQRGENRSLTQSVPAGLAFQPLDLAGRRQRLRRRRRHSVEGARSPGPEHWAPLCSRKRTLPQALAREMV